MLTPPDGLSEELLVSVLARHWGLEAAAISYRAVGFGSHHWEVTDAAGERWFLTADELLTRRMSVDEPPEVTVGRLRHALAAAAGLRAEGHRFVVAPVPSGSGEPAVLAGDAFAVALYPFVAGQSFEWGEFCGEEHRQAVLGLVIGVHTAPQAVRAHALTDDYAVAHRDELDVVLARAPDGPAETGPYSGPVRRLVGANTAAIGLMLSRYDELAARATAMPARAVLTHGEPHPGNTMLTRDGWRLIDWDTALAAPPERDLWMLDPGDGSVLGTYAAATGVRPLPALLELYRVRWDVADLAIDVSRFCRPHKGTAEDDQCWQLLCDLVGQLSA